MRCIIHIMYNFLYYFIFRNLMTFYLSAENANLCYKHLFFYDNQQFGGFSVVFDKHAIGFNIKAAEVILC